MLPANIKIGGLTIAVKQVCHLASDRDRYGEYSPMKQVISIDESLPKDKKMETLMHEILEALDGYLSLGLEHDKLTALSFVLHQVLKDNRLEL